MRCRPCLVVGRRFALAKIMNCKVDDFDAVVIPGGFSPDILRRAPYICNRVRESDAVGKPVAAICHAPWLAISAGIVRGRRVTSWISLNDDLTNAGALWEDGPALVDGNLITSRCPDDLPDVCLAVIAALALGPNLIWVT